MTILERLLRAASSSRRVGATNGDFRDDISAHCAASISWQGWIVDEEFLAKSDFAICNKNPTRRDSLTRRWNARPVPLPYERSMSISDCS